MLDLINCQLTSIVIQLDYKSWFPSTAVAGVDLLDVVKINFVFVLTGDWRRNIANSTD